MVMSCTYIQSVNSTKFFFCERFDKIKRNTEKNILQAKLDFSAFTEKIEDLTRVVISYEIYETRRISEFHKFHMK